MPNRLFYACAKYQGLIYYQFELVGLETQRVAFWATRYTTGGGVQISTGYVKIITSFRS